VKFQTTNDMSKLNQIKIPVYLEKDNLLKIIDDQIIEDRFNWQLIREQDGLINQSKSVIWLEWNEDGSFKSKHNCPSINRSLCMFTFNNLFTWQTTIVTEIVEARQDYIKFKTQNSNYELCKINLVN
jgi:hypothetical protein